MSTKDEKGQNGGEHGEDFWLTELCLSNGFEYSQIDYPHIQSLEMFLHGMPKIPSLKQFPMLTKLCLIGHGITKLKNLSNLTLLEELWVCECKLQQISHIDKLSRLKKLYLYDNEISKIECLLNVTNLEVLWLNSNRIGAIEGISQLKHLTDLNLSENRISSIGNALSKNHVLSTLDISGNKLLSFKELTNLRGLPNLKYLGLKDPLYEPNPVSVLCNYSTYLLYHLPNLMTLDSYDVSQKALKELAESIVSKKAMYYKMRKKVIERRHTELCYRLEAEKCKLQVKHTDMLRKLIFAIKEIERESGELEKATRRSSQTSDDLQETSNANEEKKAEDPEQDEGPKKQLQLQAKLKALKERIPVWESKYQLLERNCKEAMQCSSKMTENLTTRLLVEFETGGNVKFETGSPCDIWYTSCKDLVLARFCALDFKDFQVTGLRIHKITRVQSRLLKLAFDDQHERMVEQLETMSQNARKYLDYLFYVSEPCIQDVTSETLKVVEEGFREPSFYQKYGLPGAVTLTNSVSLADKPRIKYTVKKADPGNVDKCPFRHGQLLVCKTFVGRSCQVNADKKITQSSYPDYNSVYRTRRHSVCPKRSSKSKSLNSSSSTDLCECTSRKCTWYVFDGGMVLPEYIVDFEYLTKAPPPLTKLYRELLLLESGQSIYKQESHSDDDAKECHPVDENVLNMEPIVPCRPRLTVLTDELLLKQANVSFLNKVVYLNLNGSGLTRLKPVSSLQHLRVLVVSFNELSTLSDVSGMPTLEYLDASFNNINTLEGCKGCSKLSYLDVSWNQLHYTREEVSLLRRNFPNIKSLSLAHNPWLKSNSVRLRCIGRLKHLSVLDCKAVTEEEINVANQLVHSSRISNTAIIANAVTDQTHPRVLTLSSVANTLMKIRKNELSYLIDEDNNWFSKVTCLRLDGQHLSKISNLEKLTSLRWASFNDNDITKIEGLEACTGLEELSLAGNCITKLEGLQHLTKLESLDVSNNALNSLENSQLHTLTTLRYLCLENNSLSSFKGLNNVSCLSELFLGNNKVSNLREVFHLKGMQHLIILDLQGNPFSEGTEAYRLFVIYHMFSVKALDGFSVDASEISLAKDTFGGRLTYDLIAEKLGHSSFADLTQLDLPNCNLRSIDLGNGEAFSQLRSVNLEHNNLTSFGGLIFLTGLRVLCLNHNHVECVIAKPKSTSGQLSPQKHGSETKDEGNQKLLPVLEKLEVLHLAYNGISNMSSLQLERLPALKALFLQGNNISRVEGLDGLQQLRELVLDKNKIKTIGDASFINQWKLNELHMEENRLKSLSGLEPLINLRRLFIGINRIQDITELDKLETLTSLIELSVIGNTVSRKMIHRPMLVFRQPHLLSIDGIPVTNDERAKAELYFLEQQGSIQAVQALMGQSEANLPNHSAGKPQPPLKVTTMPLSGSLVDHYWDLGARYTGFEYLRNLNSPPSYPQEFQEITRGINRSLRRHGNASNRPHGSVPYIPHGGSQDPSARGKQSKK